MITNLIFCLLGFICGLFLASNYYELELNALKHKLDTLRINYESLKKLLTNQK